MNGTTRIEIYENSRNGAHSCLISVANPPVLKASLSLHLATGGAPQDNAAHMSERLLPTTKGNLKTTQSRHDI